MLALMLLLLTLTAFGLASPLLDANQIVKINECRVHVRHEKGALFQFYPEVPTLTTATVHFPSLPGKPDGLVYQMAKNVKKAPIVINLHRAGDIALVVNHYTKHTVSHDILQFTYGNDEWTHEDVERCTVGKWDDDHGTQDMDCYFQCPQY